MYRNKKDVDKHVENLSTKLSSKEFKTRACSIARLYFDVGDYANCQKFVEQYLTQNDKNAASYKLLGQALQKLGQKEKALEKYKTSLDIDPVQTTTILDICELLADDEVTIELGRASYWCEKAEAIYPKHPVIFRLRERLMSLSNSDPEALISLLTSELAIRPKDASLHARLLKHYMNTNKIQEAFEHSCKIELTGKTFINNYAWYEILNQILKHNSLDAKNWLYQLLLLTVKERICLLSISETPSSSSQSLIESGELLHAYDQAIEVVAQAGSPPGFGEFHSSLLQHHRGQFAFHAATYLLKKAKKDQLKWHEAKQAAAPLMLIAWQTVPLDSNVNWLKNAPEKLVIAVKRWYSEGSYRCSQAGHYLLSNIQDKREERFLDQVSQSFAGTHWRDKLYKKIFLSRNHLDKLKTSHFVSSNAVATPVLRLPRKVEVEAYDSDAQREYGNSLHHFVWILLNYKNYAQFKLTLFETLKQTATACGAESLNKLDIQGFLYSAAITARQQLSNAAPYLSSEKPGVLPANITDLLCTLRQMKWWDCAYKFFHNELGAELTDIRATLTRGIEVVRCIDNHGLDPELLCRLGYIFSEKAKMSTDIDEKSQLEARAVLYYSSAIPILEKLKSKCTIKINEKRLFDYTHKEFSTHELNTLLEESKLYVAGNYLKEGEYDKVIELLSSVKSPQAYLSLSLTYKKIACEEDTLHKGVDAKPRMVAMLTKARSFAYKALGLLRDNNVNKNDNLYSDSEQLIEEIETQINKHDLDLSNVINDLDKFSSDENVSGDHLQIRSNTNIFRNVSSTPKAASNANHNNTNYRTAVDSHILETTRVEQQHLERIEREIKNLQKRDSTINEFMDQTKDWFDENRKIGNQIISTIQSNMQNTTDQFKLLKISVDQVKDQIDECRNECKDVGDMKKQIAELKKEVNKLKKASSEQAIDDSDLYNLEEEYRTNESTSSFANQLPFAPAQMMHQFGQRLVPPFPIPPNPYQLYNQSLYNLYNQYSQFAQPTSVPGSQPIFDPNRAQMNYQSVFPAPDQMYLDVAHLVPPTVPPAPIIPQVPVGPSLSTVPPVPNVSLVNVPPPISTITTSKPTTTLDSKDVPKSLPVNVVITSSDPLPTGTTAPAPVLSVTIPQKHIKGIPHNYQIPMPSTNETKTVSPPVFVFPPNKASSSASSLSNWNQASVFKTSVSTGSTTPFNPNLSVPKIEENLDNSKSVVDGIFASQSPNTSLNKSRTLSERSNTSVENYDPCPDFKPIVPLPAEVKVTTGEEDESVIFSARAKLYRFVDQQWKERGLGEMKLLKHKITGKVRVLMRREQVHKICANHIITAEMEIKPMKNETKAYFWVANDFADERVVLEKFSIRFKTADIALDFYKQFEKAQSECGATKQEENKTQNIVSVTSKTSNDLLTTPQKDKLEKSNVAPTGKAVIGGFTFSSTPTFKPVSEDTTETKLQDSAPKTSIFGSLSFNKNTTTPFSDLFTATATATSSPQSQTQEVSSKLNSSDTVEEYEPNVEFKPVVPLPALVEQKTGEEDELVLFEHRAKLLRFDAPTKEWKERGLGNIKLLVHKDNKQKLRLLMRREQIMKVCCNHAVTIEMVFQKMPNLDKAVTWCAKDFSEGELVSETFCLRFKTVQACDDFIDAVKSAQLKLKEEPDAVKEEKNNLKPNNQIGFGDSFKPKAGSWHCDTCYTNNLESFSKCACCETPKPNSADESKTQTQSTVGWGDKFKPKAGSWECKECFVRNEPNLENCSACNSPKDPTKPKPAVSLVSNNTPKFNFGIPKSSTNETQSVFGNALSDKPMKFGIPPAGVEDKQKPEPASIFGGTGGQKFNFGIPSSTTVTVITAAPFGDQKPKANLFMNQKSSFNEQPIDFSVATVEKQNVTEKPTLISTPQKDNKTGFTFTEGGTFDFVFKPKTPNKTPVKSPNRDDGEESDDNACSPEDSVHISFSPVIPMPDKVEVVTGEENEIELYGHPAKLYRFASGEWKERGKGIVKILKHKETGKLRVVMRRDQVLKICLNHALTPEITYTPKDDKTWLFAANDFSEGELSLQQFCLRFKQKEIALQFREAVDKARDGKLDGATKDVKPMADKDEDVVFVREIQATTDEKEKAKALMLPENFFTYVNKEPCQGCRGCNDDDSTKTENNSEQARSKINDPAIDVKPSITTTTVLRHPILASVQDSTPFKSSPTSVQSPTSSIYGTPTNMEKTFNASVFRTPSENIDTDSDGETTDKENTFIQKPTMFSGFGDTKNRPGNSENSLVSIFNSSNMQTPKSSLLAPPKLSTLNTSNESQEVDPKSIFGTAQVKAMTSENKSIFANANLGTVTNKFGFSDNKDNNQVSKGNSIFGGDNKNVFTQGSIFGSTTTNNQAKPTGSIFESTGVPVFGGGKSLFGTTSTVFGNSETVQKPPEPTSIFNTKTEEVKKEPEVNETPFKIDNTLSFAALSTHTSGEPASSFQKPADFKWEGAGQQLFGGSNKANNISKDDDTAGSGTNADEEYDPHYEPIVPLPDKIDVTTGEEDEEKLFGERCKLYRYDEKTREWKERGIGEMKILYHPERKTYRLLLRREQVHKAVLNMLLYMDLELLPMKNSDRAWTWAGHNFAENPAGEQETLAVRFKSVDLAINFQAKVTECARKLQSAAAKAISEEKEANEKAFGNVAPLRLPKHLQDSARADPDMSAAASQQSPTTNENKSIFGEVYKQVHFQQEHDGEAHDGEEEEEYDQDYDEYYNEEEDESAAYYSCEGEALIQQGEIKTACSNAYIQVLFDQEIYSPKILVTDASTGEILADMLIHTETEFQMNGDSCVWSGTDYTSNDPVDKTVTINFYDSDTAMQFYDSCETSKAATYSSTDPES